MRVRTVATTTVAVAVGTVAAVACGSGGGDGGESKPVTIQDMREWRQGVMDETKGVKEINDEHIVVDCEGTVKEVTDAIDRVPDPPYKGEEWRKIVDGMLDTVNDGLCDAIEEGDIAKMSVLEEKMNIYDAREQAWVQSANERFPGLDWYPDSYLR